MVTRSSVALRLVSFAALAVLVTGIPPAAAHEGNVGVSEIRVERTEVAYLLYLDVRHLASVLPVVDDPDVVIDDARDGHGLGVRRADVAALVGEHLAVSAAGVTAPSRVEGLRVVDNADLGHLGGVALMGSFALLEVDVRFAFPAGTEGWRIDYDLFFPDADAEPHSNLAWITAGGVAGTHIFTPDRASLGADGVTPLVDRPDATRGAVGLAAATGLVLAAGAGGWAWRGRHARGRRPAGGGRPRSSAT